MRIGFDVAARPRCSIYRRRNPVGVVPLSTDPRVAARRGNPGLSYTTASRLEESELDQSFLKSVPLISLPRGVDKLEKNKPKLIEGPFHD